MLNRAVGFFLRNTAGFLGGKSGRESRGVKNGGEEPGYLREWSHVLRRSKQPRGFVKSTHEIWRTLETSIGELLVCHGEQPVESDRRKAIKRKFEPGRRAR